MALLLVVAALSGDEKIIRKALRIVRLSSSVVTIVRINPIA
jgi:hypothetical protein